MSTPSIGKTGDLDLIQVEGNLRFEHIPAKVTAGAMILAGRTSGICHTDDLISKGITVVRKFVKGVEQPQ
jgi:hypothetical protein